MSKPAHLGRPRVLEGSIPENIDGLDMPVSSRRAMVLSLIWGCYKSDQISLILLAGRLLDNPDINVRM